MLDKLFNLFSSDPLHKVTGVISLVSDVIQTFEKEFEQDQNAKNAAIDTIIDILQKHKST